MNTNQGMGRALFAVVLLCIDAVVGLAWGIAAISNSDFFVHHTNYAFGSLKTWGWVAVILAVVEFIAALSLVRGGAFGRWFAIVVGALAAIEALYSIPAYPLWSLAVFALSLWIIHGLAVYEGPSDRTASAEATQLPPDRLSNQELARVVTPPPLGR
jgi:hypothetical protein